VNKLSTICSQLQYSTCRALLALGLALGLSACSAPGGYVPLSGGDTWQEEVLLHDGQKLIAERTTMRGGRHEVGQKGDYIAQRLRFTLPGTSQTVEWEDTHIDGLGNSSFLLLALHVVDKVPYVVATPMGCLSYNKWGRPNPPYVIFKAQASQWERINLTEFPATAQSANLLHSAPDDWVRRNKTQRVTAQQIQAENATDQPEYRSILREPMNYDPSCIPMVTNGKGLWRAQGWFSKKPSLEACLVGCKSENFDSATCPCNQLFKGE